MVDLDTEEQLLERARSTNEGFAELFDKCYDRVYAYVFRRVRVQPVAEDIAECVFEDALRGIDKVRWQGKPVIAWLFRIASRRIADHFRSREPAALDEESYRSTAQSSQEGLEDAERRMEVRRAIEQLSPAEREIIRLTYFDELEPSEISAVLGISRNSIYVRHHRALGHLQGLLAGNGG